MSRADRKWRLFFRIIPGVCERTGGDRFTLPCALRHRYASSAELPGSRGILARGFPRKMLPRGPRSAIGKGRSEKAPRPEITKRGSMTSWTSFDGWVSPGISSWSGISSVMPGKTNIPVGPGRGSAAGSVVSYALGITDIDPLEYDLLFERFLNPERISMPDIDIDFCQRRREEVIDYVRELYGEESVSPDRHLQHSQSQVRGPGCRPCHGDAVRRCGSDRQADSRTTSTSPSKRRSRTRPNSENWSMGTKMSGRWWKPRLASRARLGTAGCTPPVS